MLLLLLLLSGAGFIPPLLPACIDPSLAALPMASSEHPKDLLTTRTQDGRKRLRAWSLAAWIRAPILVTRAAVLAAGQAPSEPSERSS